MHKEKIKFKLKNASGITLIALIVTIIVILILAGVTISLTMNDRGIFQKTKESVSLHVYSEAEEEAKLEGANLMAQRYENHEITLAESAQQASTDLKVDSNAEKGWVEVKPNESENAIYVTYKDSKLLEGKKSSQAGKAIFKINLSDGSITPNPDLPDPTPSQGSSLTLDMVASDITSTTITVTVTPSGNGIADNPEYTCYLNGEQKGDPTNSNTYTYTVAATNSGYTSDQSFDSTNSAMNIWRVWKVDKANNVLEIVSSGDTGKTLYLSGSTGYNQGPGIMNAICLTLYSNSSKEITARSLDMIDIEEAMAENWGTTRGSSTFNTKITNSFATSYGSSFSPKNSAFNNAPNCYTTADIQSQQSNDLRPNASTDTGYTLRSGFKCKMTSFIMSGQSKVSEAIGATRQSILGTRERSWIASRCVTSENNNIALFEIPILIPNSLWTVPLFKSTTYIITNYAGLTPLCQLNASDLDYLMTDESTGFNTWQIN